MTQLRRLLVKKMTTERSTVAPWVACSRPVSVASVAQGLERKQVNGCKRTVADACLWFLNGRVEYVSSLYARVYIQGLAGPTSRAGLGLVVLPRLLQLRATLQQRYGHVQGLSHVSAAAARRRCPRQQLIKKLCAAYTMPTRR